MEIQRADPTARRRATWIVAGVIVFGGLVLYSLLSLESSLMLWLENNANWMMNNPLLVFLGSLVFVSPILFGMVFLFLYGRRAIKAERMPPSGYRVARDTVVVSGDKARFRGRMVQLLSVILFLLTLLIPLFLALIFMVLGSMER